MGKSRFILALAVAALPLVGSTFARAETPASSPAAVAAPDHREGWEHRFDPERHKRMCLDHFAREKAHLTYLETRLVLTDAQKDAWNKWAAVRLQSAEQMRDGCFAFVPPKEGVRPTVVERSALMQKHMSLHLTALQEAQPALQALYEQLSAAQREVFDGPEFEGPGLPPHMMMHPHHMHGEGGQERGPDRP